jgi:hypothetical protein
MGERTDSIPFRRKQGMRFAANLQECPVGLRQEFDGRADALGMPKDERFRRYVASTPEIHAGTNYIIDGDGPDAIFRYFVVDDEVPDELPYKKFRHSLKATFREGWQLMESLVPPEELESWRAIYHSLLDDDETSFQTPHPIDETHFAYGVELAMEMPYYAIMFGLASEKDAGMLQASDGEILENARSNASLIKARARMNLLRTFSNGNHYQSLDCENAYFVKGAGKRRLVAFNLLPDDETPEELLKLTVACPADLVKLEEKDNYSLLENCVFASINKMHEWGLFRPEIARKTWEMRKSIDESLHHEETILGLGMAAVGNWRFIGQNLSHYRNKRRDLVI